MRLISGMINLKKLITQPETFFANLKKEKGVKDAYLFFIVASAFSTLMSFVMFLLIGNFMSDLLVKLLGLPPATPLSTTMMFLAFLTGFVINLGLIFVWAGLVHVWIKIFGGKESYAKTFNMYIYAFSPLSLLNWIPFVSFFVWIYSLILLIVGTHKIHGFSRLKSALIYIIPLVIILVLAVAAYALMRAVFSVPYN